ncbi:MAG: hypothetical protein CM15mL5_2050 [uncultured marine virus]|nr:MAG: hypothetical protein CM15mL5_2050 [uncultured marine virus]
MPNWCRNRVDFYSENKEDLNKVLDIFSNKESIFGQIIPEPNWKTTPNDKGELPFKDPSEPMFPPKFPDQVLLTTDGICGEFQIGTPSGTHATWTLKRKDTKMNWNLSKQTLIQHGHHPKQSVMR